MTVGESGNGKSTACRTLLRSFRPLEVNPLDIEILVDSTGKTLNIGRLGVVETTTDEYGTQPCVTHIYDSKGYGDSVNNQSDFDAIRDNLIERHRKYNSTELNGLTADERNAIDERIHCCLYFISPHRMKPIDEIFIESLADVVNIVPVIAKSDTMKMEEREKFLQEVVAKISLIQKRIREKHDLRAIFQFDLSDAKTKFMKKRDIRENPERYIATQGSEETVAILNHQKIPSTLEYSHLKRSGESDDDDDDDEDDEDEDYEIEEMEHRKESDSNTVIPTAMNPPVSEVSNHTDDFPIESFQTACRMDQSNAVNASTTLPPSAVAAPPMDICRTKNIFAIISDPDLCRAYPWGTAFVDKSEHSDFPLLKEYLFRIESIRSMIEATTRRSKLVKQRDHEGKEEEVKRQDEIATQLIEEEENQRVMLEEEIERRLQDRVKEIRSQIEAERVAEDIQRDEDRREQLFQEAQAQRLLIENEMNERKAVAEEAQRQQNEKEIEERVQLRLKELEEARTAKEKEKQQSGSQVKEPEVGSASNTLKNILIILLVCKLISDQFPTQIESPD
jgi:septin family protein